MSITTGYIVQRQEDHPHNPELRGPAPAGGLVEMVVAAMEQPTLHTFDHFARAAILACAMWLEERSFPTAAHLLQEEVECG